MTGVDTAAGGSSTQRTLAIGAAAVGVLGLAAGGYFGLKASSTWSDAKNGCTAYPAGCSTDASALASDAKNQATFSTVAFAVGAAGVLAGAVLWFTAPRSSEGGAKLALGVGPTGVVVRGGF